MRGSVFLAAGLLALAIPAPVRALDPATPISQYTLATWDERDGLAGTVIRSIVQDTRGYLWLGTSSGLLRFDGVRFTRVDVPRASHLPFSEIGALAAGRDGSVWVGFLGAGGVSRLHGGRSVTFSTADGLPDAAVTALVEDAAGTIWAGTRLGLSRLKNNRWELIDAAKGLPPLAVPGLRIDREGQLSALTVDGRFRYVPSRDAFERAETSGSSARESFPDRDGNQSLRDRDGNLWLGGFDGLTRLQPRSAQADRSPAERLTHASGLPSTSVLALHEDREGNLWIGTRAGLARLSDAMFHRMPPDSNTRDDEIFRAVAATPDGALWAAGQAGLYRILNGQTTMFDERQGLPSPVVTALHVDAAGRLLAATGRGVARLSGSRFQTILGNTDATDTIRSLTIDPSGSLWMTDTGHGIVRTPLNGGGAGATTLIRPNIALPLLTDRQGRTWIGFADGRVGVYEQDQLRVFSHQDGLVGDRAAAIHEDRAGRIWIGANGALSRFDGTRFATLDTRSGLPLERITAIIEDDSGTLWLAVGAGIVRVAPGELDKAFADPVYRVQFEPFDISDGLAGSPSWIGYPTSARTTDGRLWFVTSQGLSVVHAGRGALTRTAPPVLIEDAFVDDRPIDTVSAASLPAGTSRLEINYTSLSFSAPAKVRFRYRLDGFDKDWVDAGARRQAFYTNLAPGTYAFRVLADVPGAANSAGTAWEFSIEPAFHQTWAFYALVALAAGGAVLGGWKLRTRKIRAQFAAVLNERTRMGREIHDTLLQGLVGVALQLDDLSHRVETSPGTAPSFIARLREQVERYIRETRQSIWVLRSPSLETDSLPEALKKLGVALAGRLRFDFVSTGTPRLDPTSDEQLPRIAQEAIANATRHGRATSIRLELAYQDHATVLRVVDDGVGFDMETADQVSSGHWGLLGMRERAQQAGGRCRILSRPGHGTEIEVVLPSNVQAAAHA